MANPPRNSDNKWFKWFKLEENTESTSDARSILLVVVTLIAAVTFQAGVSPPGGVWQDEKDGHKAGNAIYASQKPAYYVFLISNTLALSSSILVIISLTLGFPFYLEILVATLSMIVTYGSSVFAVTPDESVKFRFIMAVAAVPFVLRVLIHVCKCCKK